MAQGIDPIATARQALGAPKVEPSAELSKFRRAAREFDSLFLNELLKSMRSSSSILNDSEDTDSGGVLMRELMDEQLARSLAHGGGLGLARMLEEQYAPQLRTGPVQEGLEGVADAKSEIHKAADIEMPGDIPWKP